jgi:drug/metabolite transporter (DMT)-like permease
MAWAGMAVGSLCLVAVGVLGVVPISASTADVLFLHHRTSWLVPVLGISLVAAVFAYAAGIKAARALGAKLASFRGLSEVLFAVLFAWLLVGQLPGLSQIVGGAFIIGGVALVQWDELRPAELGTDELRPAELRPAKLRPAEARSVAGAEDGGRPLVAAEPDCG